MYEIGVSFYENPTKCPRLSSYLYLAIPSTCMELEAARGFLF